MHLTRNTLGAVDGMLMLTEANRLLGGKGQVPGETPPSSHDGLKPGEQAASSR